MNNIKSNGIALVNTTPDWTPGVYDTTLARLAGTTVFFFWTAVDGWVKLTLTNHPENHEAVNITQSGTAHPVAVTISNKNIFNFTSGARIGVGDYQLYANAGSVDSRTIAIPVLDWNSAAFTCRVQMDPGGQFLSFKTYNAAGSLVELNGSMKMLINTYPDFS